MYSCFFLTDTATTEIYTLSLHDALPISCFCQGRDSDAAAGATWVAYTVAISHAWRYCRGFLDADPDRKSTRLNSSHEWISYAVFCLKKKNFHKYLQTRCDHDRRIKT